METRRRSSRLADSKFAADLDNLNLFNTGTTTQSQSQPPLTEHYPRPHGFTKAAWKREKKLPTTPEGRLYQQHQAKARADWKQRKRATPPQPKPTVQPDYEGTLRYIATQRSRLQMWPRDTFEQIRAVETETARLDGEELYCIASRDGQVGGNESRTDRVGDGTRDGDGDVHMQIQEFDLCVRPNVSTDARVCIKEEED